MDFPVCNHRYHTGYPRKEQVSRVLEFKSERQFVDLLHQGKPVAVAFTLKYLQCACNLLPLLSSTYASLALHIG